VTADQVIIPAAIGSASVLFIFFVGHLAAMPYRMAKTREEEHRREMTRAEQAHDLTRSHLKVAEQRHEQALAEVEHLRAEPVSPKHFQELNTIIRRMLAAVDENKKLPEGKDRRAILGHFPELDQRLLDWDQSIQNVYDRTADLEAKMWTEANRLGITEPVFTMDALIPTLLAATRLRADRGQLALPFEFTWFQAHDEVNGEVIKEPVLWMKGCSTAVATLDRVIPPLEGSEAVARIEALFFAAQEWSETLVYAIRDKASGWIPLKAPLVDTLGDLAERDHYKRGNGCPRCN